MFGVFIVVGCVFIGVLSYRFYFAHFFTEVESEKKQIEVVSELEGITVFKNKTFLDELSNRFGVWNEGVFIRGEFDRPMVAIPKTPVKKIKIVLTYNYKDYKRDKVFSQGQLISSAKEERLGDELIILLGFSKKFLDGLDNEKKEMFITQSYISTLYRISHTGQNFKSREERLKEILVEHIEANRNLFKIK